MLVRGRVALVAAGRDKGKLQAVTGCDEKGIYLADGKGRRLCSPKLKNPRHLIDTGYTVAEEFFASDRALRRALAQIRDQRSEMLCQNQII